MARYIVDNSCHPKSDSRHTRQGGAPKKDAGLGEDLAPIDCHALLVACPQSEISPIASTYLIQFAPGLPKNRSGKTMRRILRKIAQNEFSNLGDILTLADPAVIDDLIGNRQNKAS